MPTLHEIHLCDYVSGWNSAHVGGWPKQERWTLAYKPQQTTETYRLRQFLVGNGKFHWYPNRRIWNYMLQKTLCCWSLIWPIHNDGKTLKDGWTLAHGYLWVLSFAMVSVIIQVFVIISCWANKQPAVKGLIIISCMFILAGTGMSGSVSSVSNGPVSYYKSTSQESLAFIDRSLDSELDFGQRKLMFNSDVHLSVIAKGQTMSPTHQWSC